MKFSIVLSTDPAQFEAVAFKGDVAHNIGRMAAMGYGGIELAVRNPDEIDRGAVERALQQHDLQAPAIGTGQAYGEEKLSFTDAQPDVRAAAVARIKRQIDFAATLDAVVILGLIRGVTPPGVEPAQALQWLANAMHECAAHAAQENVRLVIEPINRYETDIINNVEEGLRFIKDAGLPPETVGLLPDTFHMNIEEPSIEGSLRQARGAIFHFHVADSNRWYPGAGHLDFQRILTLLREDLDYDGWISAETLPRPDGPTAAERGLAHLQKCLLR